MLSDNDLWRIVDHFRKEVKPREISSIGDVTKQPNDVLMSYYITDEGPALVDLVDFLKHTEELNEALTLYYPKHYDNNLPSLGDHVDYNEHPISIAGAIEAATGKFTQGYDEVKLIVADKVPQVYRYPSGKEVEYFSLVNEKSANISIFEGAFMEDICIRESYITLMLALNEYHKDNPDFVKYKKYMERFSEFIHGPIIAHELSEQEIVKNTEAQPRTLQLELESALYGRDFLEENKVDLNFFELYHLLRANEDERGRNFSKIIVDQLL